MSGIGALVTLDGSPADRGHLESMVAAAPHRGRDEVAVWLRDGAGLARLATLGAVEPDEIGVQPLELDGAVIVADARIDNRNELVAALGDAGALPSPDRGMPVAELILRAHHHWGDGAAGRLVGDFAYVIWEIAARRVVMARDPMGMRPLYYRHEPGRRAVVASELKQILVVPGVPREVDERSAAATLAGAYLAAEATLYRGIAQLAPGHQVVIDAWGERRMRTWAPDPFHRVSMRGGDAALAYRSTLAQAVADRMRGARPVGLMLSGGVDSGSVAAVAGWLRDRGQVAGEPLRAYSWALPATPDSDERSVSDIIVRGSGLVGVAVDGDDAWPLARYPEHGPDEDDPYLWTYQALVEKTVSRAASDGIGVLMAGDHGDELVGGSVYDELGLMRAGRMLSALHDLRHAAREDRTGLLSAMRTHLVRPLRAELRGGARRSRRRSGRSSPWGPWLRNDFARRTELAEMVEAASSPARFDGHARNLRHRLLFSAHVARTAVLQNRTRARAGLGFADPYADRRLVELVLALPQWQVQRRGQRKRIALEAMRGIMPEAARERVGENVPRGLFERGFGDRSVQTIRSLLLDTHVAARGWIDEATARAEYEQSLRERRPPSQALWWTLMVEMWLRRWWP